jgi:hypothetical protein
MPLFNKSVVKMGKGCDLTEEDWIESVKKQDMTYEHVTIPPEEVEQIVSTLLGGPYQYSDSDKSWSEVQDECD